MGRARACPATRVGPSCRLLFHRPGEENVRNCLIEMLLAYAMLDSESDYTFLTSLTLIGPRSPSWN